ncbi:hypothetical protein ROA7450_02422 [Roseovarius albus]|uniref:D-galactarate dehydratase n=2 Tax=Roseovarius albus TaxID=1247867 RepID=A0A1X6ZGI6_9RHOB|nr:hypothetical protein ROA7450_02422 [Roseovarius albus]
MFKCFIVSMVVLVGCADGQGVFQKWRDKNTQELDTKTENGLEAEPAVLTDAPPPPKDASSVEEFDTTTATARAEAVKEAETSNGAKFLGNTIASLGAPTEPGIWMKTSLVKSQVKGRVDYPAKGTSVVVELVPLEASKGAGSQISLAAMRLIEADLTGLPEVKVYQLPE